MDGARLTLTYDVRLNPAKVPGPDRFTLHYPLGSGQTDRLEYRFGVAEAAVRGKKVVLELSNPVHPCDTAPTVQLRPGKDRRAQPPGHRRHKRGRDLARGGGQQAG